MQPMRVLQSLLLSLGGILLFPLSHHGQSPPVRKFVTVAGKKMCYISAGLEKRKPGEPVIIFEAGFGAAGTLIFNNIFPAMAKIAPSFAYDRNGEGKSDLDTSLATGADITKRLHALLQTLHVDPPYVLIGHSLGGPYIRLYTALYRNEVKGLVFLDPPSPLTEQQLAAVKRLGPAGWDLGKSNLQKTLTDPLLPPMQRFRTAHLLNTVFKDGYFQEYASLPPLPDVPVAVLMAYNYHPQKDTTERQQLIRKANDTINEYRIQNYTALVANNHNSFVMLLPGFKHFIYEQDPDLIISVIERIYRKALKLSARSHSQMQNR